MSFMDVDLSTFEAYDYLLMREYDRRNNQIGTRRFKFSQLKEDAIFYRYG